MKVEVVMPQMGESIAEGTILKWLKKVGDTVGKDENILEISTDKVDSEIPSPSAGKIVELKANEGDTVPVGEVIAILETEAKGSAQNGGDAGGPKAEAESAGAKSPATSGASAESRAAAGPAAPAAASAPKAEPSGGGAPTATASAPAPSRAAEASAPSGAGANGGEVPRQSGDRFYSPLVRSIARTEGVGIHELDRIPGSGRDGRLTKDDLLTYLESRGSAPSTSEPARSDAPPAAPQAAPGAMAAPVSTMPVYTTPAAPSAKSFEAYPQFQVAETRQSGEGRIDVVVMDKMRHLIAEHMVRSKATSPHVASVTEVDMTSIVRYRESAKKSFGAQSGFKLTYTPFIVQAAVRALVDYPMMNSTIDNGQILLKRYINLGVAVALESGLIVPVVKHAEEKNFLGIARAIDDLANRARTKQLKPDDVAGGTFTLTNMGSFGNLFGIPIINQPQSGILGVGAIVKRPVVVGDAIAIRDIMYLSLSYDHRHVDGKLGGLFIQRVRHYLETFDPGQMS